MRKTTKRSVLMVGALAAIGAGALAAQDDVVPRDGRGEMRRGMRVEAIMSMRERLELTDEQVASLDEIRSEIVERRSTQLAESAEMRSRLAAGQIRRSEMMAFVEDRRDANAGVMPRYRERIEAVLDEAQLETLQEVRTRGRAAMRGREGQGMRGEGRRGDRHGPRQIG